MDTGLHETNEENAVTVLWSVHNSMPMVSSLMNEDAIISSLKYEIQNILLNTEKSYVFN